MQFLKNLKEIYQGFKNYAFENEGAEAVAKDRAMICAGCPNNKDNFCDLCSCWLPAKTRSPQSKCPDGKWL